MPSKSKKSKTEKKPSKKKSKYTAKTVVPIDSLFKDDIDNMAIQLPIHSKDVEKFLKKTVKKDSKKKKKLNTVKIFDKKASPAENDTTVGLSADLAAEIEELESETEKK